MAVTDDLIDEVNSADALTWTAGHHEQWDGVSVADARALMGTKLAHSRTVESLNPVGDIPENFDARTHWPGCVGAIRNQLQCGSCWVKLLHVTSD